MATKKGKQIEATGKKLTEEADNRGKRIKKEGVDIIEVFEKKNLWMDYLCNFFFFFEFALNVFPIHALSALSPMRKKIQ